MWRPTNDMRAVGIKDETQPSWKHQKSESQNHKKPRVGGEAKCTSRQWSVSHEEKRAAETPRTGKARGRGAGTALVK